LENHYWRAFNMNTFTGGQAYEVTSVEFGIEQAESLFGTDQPLTVNLYINHGAPFPGGDWQSNLLTSSGEIRIPNQEDTIFNVPLAATVPAGTLELVMEVLSPDQTAEHNFFIIGSNPDLETGLTTSARQVAATRFRRLWSAFLVPCTTYLTSMAIAQAVEARRRPRPARRRRRPAHRP
jgi:hypothetical protein